MQPIGDYLKKLLYQYDCLVVPGLGAFLTNAVPAFYNEQEGLFFPPRRRLAFNEAMRLDDGILTNYIMFHEACGRDAALLHIAGFVHQIKQAAQRDGSYTIAGIGLFSFNTENSLQFDPELRHNFLSSAYGLQPVRYAPVLAATQPAPELTLAEPVELRDAGRVVDLPTRTAIGWRWAAAALLVGTLGLISYFTVIQPDQGLQGSLNPASMFRLFTPSSLHMPTVSRETALANATAPVPAVAEKPVVSETPASALATVPLPAPATKAAGLAATTPGVKPAFVVPVKVVAVRPARVVRPVVKPFVGRPFMVVAGSFASRQNALRLRKQLVAAGYTEATLLPVHRGELIKVAAVGAVTLDEATARKDSLSVVTGVPALIMRNR